MYLRHRVINSVRCYATRFSHDSPFDHINQNRKSRFINWKTTGLFFLLGGFISYNETLFNYYEQYTQSIDSNDPHAVELLKLQLGYKMKQLPIYQSLSHPSTNQWYKHSSWENLDRNVLENKNKSTLTNQTLRKPGGIMLKPLTFHNIETDENVTILHVGYRLCGYPFIIHGGMIATLLNETFKRNASLSKFTHSNLKDDFKVENLSINYRYPTLANQFLIVKTKLKDDVRNDTKTIRLESRIEDSKGKLLVKSTALLHDTGRATKLMKHKEEKWYRKIW